MLTCMLLFMSQKAKERKAERNRKYYQKNKTKLDERHKKYMKTSETWKKYHRDRERQRRKDPRVKAQNKIYYQQRKALLRARRAAVKEETLLHYSNNKIECGICGYNNPDALCIDHIYQDGASMRKKHNISAGGNFYFWLKQHHFPSGYRVLCCNCNQLEWIKHLGSTLKKYHMERRKVQRAAVKEETLLHYSNNKIECAICGYNNPDALCIIHNDGASMTSNALYSWLKQHHFPSGYRVLCCNCNQLKWFRHLGYTLKNTVLHK